MLRVAILFLIIALLAGAFGLYGVESAATQFAKIAFFVFLVLFVVYALPVNVRSAPCPRSLRPPSRSTRCSKVSTTRPISLVLSSKRSTTRSSREHLIQSSRF